MTARGNDGIPDFFVNVSVGCTLVAVMASLFWPQASKQARSQEVKNFDQPPPEGWTVKVNKLADGRRQHRPHAREGVLQKAKAFACLRRGPIKGF